jgi:hypothetical protein
MKFAFNKFVFLFGGLITIALINLGCKKDSLTSNVKIIENVGKIVTVQMQMYGLIDQLRKGFDESILPFGVKKQLIDSNVIDKSRTYKIDFGKGLLCGDYITRTGVIVYKHILDHSKNIDSVFCQFNKFSDSFGYKGAQGFYLIHGWYSIKNITPTADQVNSAITVMKNSNFIVRAAQTIGVRRLLANPTVASFNDGYEFNAGATKVFIEEGNTNNYEIDVDFTKCARLINAANFPEIGKLTCNTLIHNNNMEPNTIVIDFDPLGDSKSDKIAKANWNQSEWFFEIQ